MGGDGEHFDFGEALLRHVVVIFLIWLKMLL